MPSIKISPEHSPLQVQAKHNEREQKQQDQLRFKDLMQDNQGQPMAGHEREGPIFSVSRPSQMVRARTLEQRSSPIKATTPIGETSECLSQARSTSSAHNQDGTCNLLNLSRLRRHSSRLKSQASILSFNSQGQRQYNQRPVDVEGDKFLRRFATNNSQQRMSLDRMSQSHSDDSSSLRKLCLNLLSGNYVIDPARLFYYRWLQLISLAVSYNIVFIIGRGIFWNMHNYCPRLWYFLDYICDFIYLLDMLAQSRTGYLEQGILVRNSGKLARHYFESYAFKVDLISVIPTDLSYSWLATRCLPNRVPCSVIVRLNRLFRFHRLAHYFERTESATNFPFIFRISKLVFYILVIIHWNACVYFALSYVIGFGSDRWVYQPAVPALMTNSNSTTRRDNATEIAIGQQNSSSNLEEAQSISTNNINNNNFVPYDDSNMINDPLVHQYIYCFYWSTLTLTTIGEVPMPERDEEYLFVVIDLLLGMLIFATIVGNIGSMITSMNAARAEFQHKMDSVKQWMKFRKVNKELEERIIKWFDYLWANRQTLDEDAVTAILPDRLKAETAIHVHLETLKRVQLFQDCEPGLLVQLVLKLKLQVFSPGDFICRVGDVGKEMYIVKRGELNVLSEDCTQVYGKLTDGSVFGELSILNISGVKTGNRRTANVRSVGYSDLFALSKQDLWQVLEDYPDAKTMLIDRGKEILRKDGLLVEDDQRNHAASLGVCSQDLAAGLSEGHQIVTQPLNSVPANRVAINTTSDNNNNDKRYNNIVTNDPCPPERTLSKTATSMTSADSSTKSTMTSYAHAKAACTADGCPLVYYHNVLVAQHQHHQQQKAPLDINANRTPSLFGLSGDSAQLEQLMMNFQQQQSKLHLQDDLQTKSFPIQVRSSIIRKRQSLNAVFEGQQQPMMPSQGDTRNQNHDLSRFDNNSSSFDDSSPITDSSKQQQQSLPVGCRRPKMKKSLSFVLPGAGFATKNANCAQNLSDLRSNSNSNRNNVVDEIGNRNLAHIDCDDSHSLAVAGTQSKISLGSNNHAIGQRFSTLLHKTTTTIATNEGLEGKLALTAGGGEQPLDWVALTLNLMQTLNRLCLETSQTQDCIKLGLQKLENLLTQSKESSNKFERQQQQKVSPLDSDCVPSTSASQVTIVNACSRNVPSDTDIKPVSASSSELFKSIDSDEESSVVTLSNKKRLQSTGPEIDKPATAYGPRATITTSKATSTLPITRSTVQRLKRTFTLRNEVDNDDVALENICCDRTARIRDGSIRNRVKCSTLNQSHSDGCLILAHR